MARRIIPTKAEDAERRKLPELVEKLGLNFEKEGSKSESVVGKIGHRRLYIRVYRLRLRHDILEYSLHAPSTLVAVIYKENLLTKAGHVLAKTLRLPFPHAYYDIESGDKELDDAVRFVVKPEHSPFLEALLDHEDTIALLKKIFSHFHLVEFTANEIKLKKWIEEGDLDVPQVSQCIEWIKKLDRLDGLYF
jgi:hypothetical protein